MYCLRHSVWTLPARDLTEIFFLYCGWSIICRSGRGSCGSDYALWRWMPNAGTQQWMKRNSNRVSPLHPFRSSPLVRLCSDSILFGRFPPFSFSLVSFSVLHLYSPSLVSWFIGPSRTMPISPIAHIHIMGFTVIKTIKIVRTPPIRQIQHKAVEVAAWKSFFNFLFRILLNLDFLPPSQKENYRLRNWVQLRALLHQ